MKKCQERLFSNYEITEKYNDLYKLSYKCKKSDGKMWGICEFVDSIENQNKNEIIKRFCNDCINND